MADSKITALTALTAADPANDMIPIVDVSDTPPASGNTKRISINNILACSPSATLASATITGDLTVDTSTLKVDSTNNRVGIGTATPSTALHVGSGTGLNNLGVGLSRGATTNFYEAFDGTKTFLAGTDSSQTGVKVGSLTNHSMFLVCNNITQLQIDPLGVFSFTDGAGGTRMTLNSTGLGVGGSPAYKLTVQGADNSIFAQLGGTNRQVRLSTSAISAVDNASFNFIHTSGSGRFTFQNNSGTQTMLTIDDNGNNILRMPVTPPTLGVNLEGTFNLTSNTNLRISVRGTDGTTRVANITLA